MGDKLQRYYQNFPKIFKAETNPVINALLQGFAEADEEICTQLANCKAQLFIKTANGQYLTRLANSLGVERPVSLGISDETYRNLVPNLSLKSKQIRKTFYDTMDVFWGPLFSRANVTSLNDAPYNVSTGDKIQVSINGEATQEIKVLAGDIAVPGVATSAEIITILSRLKSATPSIVVDNLTGDEYINIRTDAVGLVGSVEIISSSMLGAGKLDLTLGKYELWKQAMKTVIYEINPNELTIELPIGVFVLSDSLKGSHHIHSTATIETPVAPNNGIWQGSFLYNTDGSYNNFEVSSQRAKIKNVIQKGKIYTSVTVDDASGFLETQGDLVFDFGTEKQEQPVKYRGVPSNNLVLIDPSYVFQYSHAIDSYINVVTSKNATIPRTNGSDLGIYLNSPSDDRTIVQTILETLVAAGVIVNFVITVPNYRYLISDPY